MTNNFRADRESATRSRRVRRLGAGSLDDCVRQTHRGSKKTSKTLRSGGRACKPESSGSLLFSISCVESTNTACQRSQFCQPKQVLRHSYGTIFFRVLSHALLRKARFSPKCISTGLLVTRSQSRQTPRKTSPMKSLGLLKPLPHFASVAAVGFAATISSSDLPCFLRAATFSRVPTNRSR